MKVKCKAGTVSRRSKRKGKKQGKEEDRHEREEGKGNQ